MATCSFVCRAGRLNRLSTCTFPGTQGLGCAAMQPRPNMQSLAAKPIKNRTVSAQLHLRLQVLFLNGLAVRRMLHVPDYL
jgi:hypothetical protein